MSTKIYNGVRFKISTLELLLDKFKLLQKQLMKTAITEECKVLARLATRRLDLATITGQEDANPFYSAAEELSERQRRVKITGQRDPSVDFSFSVVAIPTDHLILGTFYSENEVLVEMFSKQNWVEDYHYQDSTDKPSEISQFEWETREKTWKKFLNINAPTMYSGFTYTMTEISNAFGAKMEQVADQIPDLEERARGLAADVALMGYFKETLGDKKVEGREAMSLAMEFLRKEENKAKIEETRKDLLTKLKSVVTKYDLNPDLKNQ